MRFNQALFEKVKSRNFLGENAPYGRVTVDPYWSLEKTPPIYGNSFRGPYRYYTDGNPVEYEVPSIKSITWDRSNGQDVASCTITLYNSWHNANTELPQFAGQLGNKGNFWPKRGQGDSSVTWEQTPGIGAYTKEGIWDTTFSWENVLVEDVIIRTYEGMGIAPVSGDFKSIQEHITAEEAWITGVWIVNTVTAGNDGLMTLQCSDIGRILIDQIVFPPVVPSAVYPLEYYPPGKTAFDSPWGPKVKGGVRTNEFGQEVSTSPASKGEVWIRDFNSTADGDATVNSAYPASNAVDGNWDTYALTEAYATPDGGKPYFEFLPGGSATIGSGIDSMELKTWAGGYTVYVSIAEDPNPSSPSTTSVWKGSENIPGGGIKYVKKVDIPLYLPDGMEPSIDVEFSDVVWVDDNGDGIADPFEDRTYPNTYYAHKVRLTFENLYYSHVPDGTDRYRAGIRDFILYRNGTKVGPFTPDFEALPWTFCMEQHPTRGYWVADNSGNVYGFGDAADYDTTGFGTISLAGDSTNRVVGIAAHPSGEGYWVLDWMGNVYPQGIADNHGEYLVPNPYVSVSSNSVKVQARGIAPTHTGEGYWVVYSNGVIRGFGDASPSYATVPTNDVAIFMDAFLPLYYDPGKYIPYNIGLKATAIASHPKKMGFWVTDGSGQVWAFSDVPGEVVAHGGLVNRVYNKGNSGTFKLQNLEWATSIESTVTGDGYWIAFGSGKVASFGDATHLGKDPYVFESVRGVYEENILVEETSVMDYSFFREILWSLARDPDGTGFWVLKASGEVIAYNAEFWGKPGYDGNMPTGYRWHDGNFDGDWANIVKEILMWGGFLFYDPAITSDEAPSVYGGIESTGIITDTIVSPDKFDKKTLMDVIKELTEVVGYRFYINEEGAAIYTSPNWWRAGNFDQDGIRIYVDETTGVRVNEGDLGAIPFIPTVHESEDMLSYSATLSSANKRSEIIIGTDLPDPKDPTRTGYIRHNPPHALETVAGGVSTMRGIERTALWVSQLFENEEERKLMAELIGLHSWFSARTGSASIVGNPLLSVGDQVRMVERNTSETFIHLINGISSSLDNDTGVYSMNIETNWLGTADDWVIATESKESEYIYTVISERLNSWQRKTDRQLEGTGSGNTDYNIVYISGGFTTSLSEVATINEMIVLGDSLSYLDSTLNGLTGDRWPNLLEDYGSVMTVKNGAFSGFTSADLVNPSTRIVPPESTDVLVIFVGANDQNASLSGVSVEQYTTNLETLLSQYSAPIQLIVFPWPWTGYPPEETDPAPTEEEYNAYAAAAEAVATAAGARFLHMGNVISEIVGAAGETTWPDYIVDWIHASALGHELIAESVSNKINVVYGANSNWEFNGTISVVDSIDNAYLVVDILSNLGANVYMEVYSGSSLIRAFNLDYVGQRLNLGSLGVSGSVSEYTYVIEGIPTSRGTGRIKLNLEVDGTIINSIEDSILFLEG